MFHLALKRTRKKNKDKKESNSVQGKGTTPTTNFFGDFNAPLTD